MALTYNLEEDVRYQQGQTLGERLKEKEIIIELLKDGISIEKVAKYAKVSKESVTEIAKQLKR